MGTPDLHTELERLDELYNPFLAVLDFIFALSRGSLSNFTKKGTHWAGRFHYEGLSPALPLGFRVARTGRERL